MSLIEQDAIRMAAALEDYELVRVTDIGGDNTGGVEIDIVDERFGIDYVIASHEDYWDFLGYFCSHLQWPVKPFATAGVA